MTFCALVQVPKRERKPSEPNVDTEDESDIDLSQAAGTYLLNLYDETALKRHRDASCGIVGEHCQSLQPKAMRVCSLWAEAPWSLLSLHFKLCRSQRSPAVHPYTGQHTMASTVMSRSCWTLVLRSTKGLGLSLTKSRGIASCCLINPQERSNKIKKYGLFRIQCNYIICKYRTLYDICFALYSLCHKMCSKLISWSDLVMVYDLDMLQNLPSTWGFKERAMMCNDAGDLPRVKASRGKYMQIAYKGIKLYVLEKLPTCSSQF